jgi:formylglycine-generating enzyme required for sulfatase activity
MPSLADLPELIGFFSYSREDDGDSFGALSMLRNRVQAELRGQLGRTAKTFRLWQDKEAIPSGSLWESEIKNAIAQSIFFIPIITPTVVASPYCKFELEAFLAREAELGRNDLVFPILYIDVPGLEDSARQRNEPLLSLIAKRQYVDWRQLRHQDPRSRDVSIAVERFCTDIRDALYKPWLSPQERKEQEDAAALRQAEVERQRQDAEAGARIKEAEARQRAEAVAQSKREAEAARPAATVKQGEAAAQTPGNPTAEPAGPITPPSGKLGLSGKNKLMALAAGVAAALALLAFAGIWFTRNERAVVSPPPALTSAPPQTPACASGDDICKFCKGRSTNDACIYTPVCQAALNAVGGRGTAVGRYLTRQDQHVSFTGGHVTECSVEIWGPDAAKESLTDGNCAGDCLTIDFVWSGDIEHPVVSITNVNAVTALSATHEQDLKPKDTFQECTKCPLMMVVPAGSFVMGSPSSEPRRGKDEGPQHKVTIATQFGVGQYELTFDEWDACVADGGCRFRPSDATWGRGRQPVINVSWDDASAYVAWLAKKTGKPYRLLSESEYEYAARAGTVTAYPWGNTIGSNNANCGDCGSKWSGKQTAPVGSFAANGFGLYDMIGNVHEWTQDCYHSSYNGAPTDGSAWTGNCELNAGALASAVLRGGDYYEEGKSARSAARKSVYVNVRGMYNAFGFRVARTLVTP